MLPFFRKIRYRLAKENQFFKYSRYAIGEIVLVVIGILIALQINTWNEERKSVIELNKYLFLMTHEIQMNIFYFKGELDSNDYYINYLNALSDGNYDSINLEKAQEVICKNYINYDPSTSYKSIKENGSIGKIKSEKLLNQLNIYFEVAFKQYNVYSDWHRDFVLENIEGYMMTHLPIETNGRNDSLQVMNEMMNRKTLSMVNYQLENHRSFREYIVYNIGAAEELVITINEYLNESS